MLRPIDNYFLKQAEPARSCLQFLREHILSFQPGITEAFSYGMPFYFYNGCRFCYLWIHKKHDQPYIGFVDGNKIDHPELIIEKRARMKIFLIDPNKNIPLKKINLILKDVIDLYK